MGGRKRREGGGRGGRQAVFFSKGQYGKLKERGEGISRKEYCEFQSKVKENN